MAVALLYVLIISQLNMEGHGRVARSHGHDVRYPLLYLTVAQLLQLLSVALRATAPAADRARRTTCSAE